eukprot:SAG22_NODE_3042_length_1995_cov_3.715717_2_plen_138_part_00
MYIDIHCSNCFKFRVDKIGRFSSSCMHAACSDLNLERALLPNLTRSSQGPPHAGTPPWRGMLQTPSPTDCQLKEIRKKRAHEWASDRFFKATSGGGREGTGSSRRRLRSAVVGLALILAASAMLFAYFSAYFWYQPG